MAMFNIKLTSTNDFPLKVVQLVSLKKSLDSFYVTDSPLSVTNKEHMSMFYIKLTSLNDFL